MARRFRRNKTHIGLPEITLTPLIDTVLVLLIIFMMSMPVLQTYMNVDLPGANNGETQATSEPVHVYIDEKAQYYVNGTHVVQSSLTQAISDALYNTQDKGVVVYADKQLSYGSVVTLLDDMKAIDAAQYVALAAEPRDT